MTHPAPELRLVQPEPEPVDPLVGQTLDGRYMVERVLGQGGTGLVYRAKHAILGKSLAIKVLKPEVSRDEGVIARFRREAQSASAVGSPHICDVSDFGTLPDGSTYFVMEFLDGPSLTAAMEQQRPMNIERIVWIAQQLCDALGAAHERGIVHRDLKPDNVHLVRQGNRKDFVKVLDFGIAKVGGAADKKLTQAGQVFGTPHYMSPEQCAGRDVDHRTDIYAIGVMLYEMACGQVPFDADNLMGVLTKHVYEQPIPPREFPPPVNVPPGLEAIILKCLAKQPDARYQSMADLRADLDKVAGGLTPDAVMEAMNASMVGQSMVGHSLAGSTPYMPALAMQPAQPALAAEPPKSSRVGLIVLALLGLAVLGGGAFAAAFFLGGSQNAERVERPVVRPEPPPIVTPPVVTPPVQEQVEPPAQNEAPPAVEPQLVELTTDPPGAEVYTGENEFIGNTPVSIPRPERGQSTQLTIRMRDFQDRSFTLSHLTSRQVTVRLERARRSREGGRTPPPIAVAPTPPQPLNPPPPPVVRQPPPPRNTGLGSEIISPW